MLICIATPSRIFPLAFKLKEMGEKKSATFSYNCSSNTVPSESFIIFKFFNFEL
jgi:hypothetical protein